MMQFYMTPGSCSTGIHILLEELDLIFGVNIVNLPKGDHLSDAYRKINPKSTIPTLVLEDGTALCDFISIAYWLASRYPKQRLLPQNPMDQAKCIEMVNYVTATLHGQGFTRIFTTDKYLINGQGEDAVKARGEEIVKDCFKIVADLLGDDGGYVFERFTIADAALFYVEFWADRIGMELPKPCRDHFLLMCHRSVVQRVLAEEGYSVTPVEMAEGINPNGSF